jgi:hypothetical protein
MVTLSQAPSRHERYHSKLVAYATEGSHGVPSRKSCYALNSELVMFRAKLIVVAIALLFAQLECVAACAGQLCSGDFSHSESLPPCHRHHGHSHDQSPVSCAHPVVGALAAAPDTLQLDAPAVLLLSPEAAISGGSPAETRTTALNSSGFSPPRFTGLSCVVLRI